MYETQPYPYYSNGLLYLPESSMELLVRAGLPAEVATWIRRGMMLADSQRCDEILSALNSFLDSLNRKLANRSLH